MESLIYLDYAAATPIDKRVAHAMQECVEGEFYANPSASHPLGKKIKAKIEDSREAVSQLIGAEKDEIIWTSGATESNNLAILGTAFANKHMGNHIITLKTEHDSVLKTMKHLETLGFSVTYLTPRSDGLLNREELAAHITPKTILFSAMWVNNETGVIQNIADIAVVTQQYGIVFHVDAAQAVGKIPLNIKDMGIDLMSLSAHKMYGPKGIGALYINENSSHEIYPILHGGLQEKGLRPGTLPTHQIIGFGEACRISRQTVQNDFAHAVALRKIFYDELHGYVRPNFNADITSPYILNVNFFQLNESTQQQLHKQSCLIFSSRSACSTYKQSSHSHVLEALGMDNKTLQNSYRISTGRFTTESEIRKAASLLKSLFTEKSGVGYDRV